MFAVVIVGDNADIAFVDVEVSNKTVSGGVGYTDESSGD